MDNLSLKNVPADEVLSLSAWNQLPHSHNDPMSECNEFVLMRQTCVFPFVFSLWPEDKLFSINLFTVTLNLELV